jgi:hypothetical protein
MTENARAYIETPVNIVARMTPLPRADAIPLGPPEDGPCREVGNLPLGALASGSIDLLRAQEEAQELLRRCKHRLRKGERWAILDLLEVNIEFITVPWVRESLGRLLKGGLSLRRPGRPRFRYARHPLFIVGLVQVLIEQGRAKNTERAFHLVAELGLELSYEIVKRAYYQALRDARFGPIVLRFPELAREISAEEAGPAGRLLRTGDVATCDLGHLSIFGPTKLIIRNEGPSPRS